MKTVRDISLFGVCVGWLILSTIPSHHITPEHFVLFGVAREKWYFIYDLSNKFGALLTITLCCIPNKTMWTTVLIRPLLTDCLYEFFDLIITNDNGFPAGLIIQNALIVSGFVWSLILVVKNKDNENWIPRTKR